LNRCLGTSKTEAPYLTRIDDPAVLWHELEARGGGRPKCATSTRTFATTLARLWRDQGKGTEARDLLTPIYNWFTEGFDTPVLQDANALLDELAS